MERAEFVAVRSGTGKDYPSLRQRGKLNFRGERGGAKSNDPMALTVRARPINRFSSLHPSPPIMISLPMLIDSSSFFLSRGEKLKPNGIVDRDRDRRDRCAEGGGGGENYYYSSR